MPHLSVPTIPETYKKLRYKINYFIVDTKLKWYLTSRNPRLIQSKFQGQTLITLRVHPHDKYLVKHGEFLTLEKKEPNDYTWGSLIDLYCQEAVEKMSFPPLEEEPHTERDENFKIQQVEIAREHISKITRVSNFLRSFLTSRRPDESEKASNEDGNLAEKISGRRAFYDRLFKTREDKDATSSPPTDVFTESTCPKVWTRILSDVSLSAAQVSTGSAPTSRSEYDNLSSDLTEGRKRASCC